MRSANLDIISKIKHFVLFAIAVTIPVFASVAEARDVKVGVFHNYPICYEENGENTGFHVELLKAVAKEEGWNLVFQPGGTIKDVLNGLQTGVIDVGMSLMPTGERRVFADFTTETNVILWGQVFIKNGRTDIHNLIDLSGKKVAFIGQGTSGQNFMNLCEQFGVKAHFKKMGPYEEVARAVQIGEVDAGVFNNFQGYKYSKQYRIKPTPILFSPTPVLFAVPKGRNGDISEAIDRHLRGWKGDPDSIYYRLEEEFLSALNRKEMSWSKNEVLIAFGLCIALMAVGVFLGVFLGGRVGERSLGKVYFKHIVIFTVTITILITLIDTVMNWFLFHPGETFLEAGIVNVTPEHLYFRGMFVLTCMVFAFFFTRYLGMYTEAQSRLQKSEERYRDIVESSIDWVWEFDENEIFTYASPRIEEMLGYKPEEVIGRSAFSLMPPSEQKKMTAEFTRIKEARASFVALENINQHKSGKLIHLESSGVPVFDAEGVFRGYRGMDRDISERRVLIEKLQQAQRLEAIGTLAGGIAHDFNNILTPILGYAGLVKSMLPSDSEVQEHLQEIAKAGNRAKELVRQILTFSRQAERSRSPLKVGVYIKEALKLLRATIPTTIEIKPELDGNCGAVLADPTQIHQIIMNLCTNAYHAMRESGGVLAVTLHEKVLGEDDIHEGMNITPGKYLSLEVSDTGHGIKPEDRERIFEPYFTTKEVGDGTGMGLAVVHGIVQAYKGYISVYSEVGRGTTFLIYLPVVEGNAEERVHLEEEKVTGGDERILLVDDERDIVKLEQFLLEKLGYTVAAHTSSMAALETFSENPSEYDLVITDMTMSELTGAELSERVKAIRPGIPVIICTGFSELINEIKARELGIDGFLMKPVTQTDLARTINKVLRKEQ
ncbi:MAG: PAS domain S-box protein [Proteobacteria bacterium]|nr:PAS domain S-box protein [Pseudomonadota bacterium]MBU1738629.1 PAS domain S-box protein [Pseudomonadota bacterium]